MHRIIGPRTDAQASAVWGGSVGKGVPLHFIFLVHAAEHLKRVSTRTVKNLSAEAVRVEVALVEGGKRVL